MENLRQSQPYIVTVQNATDSVQDISIFGTFPNDPDRKKEKDGIFISSGIPGIRYDDMLWQFSTNPFKVGCMYFFIYSGDAKKIFEYAGTVCVETKDCTGMVARVPIVSTIDVYQHQNSCWTTEKEFHMDGMTSLNFALPPNSKLGIFIYPTVVVNAARALTGESLTRDYSIVSPDNSKKSSNTENKVLKPKKR